MTKASHAAPDGTVERAIAERGWVDVGELELLTGVAVEPVVGHWATTPELLEATRQRLGAAIEAAGEHGVDTAALAEHERAVVLTLDGVIVQGGRARLASSGDPYADHPLAAAIRAGGMSPETPPDADRATIRELTRRGILVERDGVLFHREAIDDAAALAADLLRRRSGRIHGRHVPRARQGSAASTRSHSWPSSTHEASHGEGKTCESPARASPVSDTRWSAHSGVFARRSR